MREDKASPPGDGDELPAPYQMPPPPPPGALWSGLSEPVADEKPAAAWDAFASATPAESTSDAAPAQSSPWDGFAAAWPAPASPPSAPVQIAYSMPADSAPRLGYGSPEPDHDQPDLPVQPAQRDAEQPSAVRARVTVPNASRLSPDQLPGSLPAGPRAATVYRATPGTDVSDERHAPPVGSGQSAPPDPLEPPAPPEPADPPRPAEPPHPPEPPQPSPEPPPPPYPTPEPRPPAPPPPSPVPPGPVPPVPVPPSPVPPGPVPPRPGPGPQPEPQPPHPPAPPAPPPRPNPPSPPPGPVPAPPFPPPPPTISGRAAPMPAPPAGSAAPPTAPAGFAPPARFAPHSPAQGLSSEYSQWARHQRPHGNLYSGPAPAATGYESPDNTDSLTGHILAQGRPDPSDGGNTTRVVMIMLIMLAAVVVITVIAIS